MSDIQSTVASYYSHIDACDIDWVIGIFASDAIYERADARYQGLGEIEHFFRVERRIRGRHIIDEIWSDAARHMVWATGVFEGQGALGDARRAGFADVWSFNKNSLVERRQTYLAVGHEYVRS